MQHYTRHSYLTYFMEPILSTQQQLDVLIKLLQHRGEGMANACRRIAAELNCESNVQRNWGWQYVHQVARGKMCPSRLMGIAVNRLYARLTSSALQYESVTILAPVGLVSPNSVVKISSQKCAYQHCNHMFIPTNPSQKYCSEECRKSKRRIANAR